MRKPWIPPAGPAARADEGNVSSRLSRPCGRARSLQIPRPTLASVPAGAPRAVGKVRTGLGRDPQGQWEGGQPCRWTFCLPSAPSSFTRCPIRMDPHNTLAPPLPLPFSETHLPARLSLPLAGFGRHGSLQPGSAALCLSQPHFPVSGLDLLLQHCPEDQPPPGAQRAVTASASPCSHIFLGEDFACPPVHLGLSQSCGKSRGGCPLLSGYRNRLLYSSKQSRHSSYVPGPVLST